ncbi:MAG: prepilin-type N-terminal cleavage/methylation domain-containing protein [Comamonadaceae bacterium]
MKPLRKRSARVGRFQTGFTLIEAIVALVLMATTGMALFSWINSNIMTLSRVQASNAEDAATANAVEYMRTVNPTLTPEGKTTLGAYRMVWKAEPLTDLRDGASYPFGLSLYQIGMYQTQVAVQTQDGTPWFSFKLQQVGYKKVRDIRPPF